MLWLLLAADITEFTAGGAGWVGTGLLGSVLLWLFFRHLPDKDKQLKEFTDAKDDQIKELIKEHTVRLTGLNEAHNSLMDRQIQRTEKLLAEQALLLSISDKERRGDFRAALDVVVNHCQRESELQREMLAKEMAEYVEALKDIRYTLEDIRRLPLGQNLGHTSLASKPLPPKS